MCSSVFFLHIFSNVLKGGVIGSVFSLMLRSCWWSHSSTSLLYCVACWFGSDLDWILVAKVKLITTALRPGHNRARAGLSRLGLTYSLPLVFALLKEGDSGAMQCSRNTLQCTSSLFCIQTVFCNQPLHTRFVLFTTKHRGWKYIVEENTTLFSIVPGCTINANSTVAVVHLILASIVVI